MKYELKLYNDQGELIYFDETELGEVAEIILSRMRKMEIKEPEKHECECEDSLCIECAKLEQDRLEIIL